MCSLSAAFPATFVNGISLSKQQRRDRFYRVKFTDIISSMEVKKPAGEIKLTVSNSKGEILKGILSSDSSEVSVLCHGFRSSKESGVLAAVSDELVQRKIATFRFDFSGNGESEGSFSYGNYWKEVDDLRAVVLFLESQEHKVTSIVGHSKGLHQWPPGGSVVMLYASKYKDVQKVVNICGRCDLRGGITERLGTEGIEEVQNKGEFEVRAGIDSYIVTKAGLGDRLSTDLPSEMSNIPLECSVLTVHGREDKTVPVEDAFHFDKLVANHKLTIIENADHTFRGCKSELSSHVAAFLLGD